MKKKNDYWFPRKRANQMVMFTNVKEKIEEYETILPYPKTKIDRIVLICDIFIVIYNYIEQTRATSKNLTDYQELIFTAKGGTKGEPAPPAPVFQTLTLPSGSFVGIFKEFKDLVAEIKTTDNYTHGIGEDLMIVGTEGEDLNPEELVMEMNAEVIPNSNRVRISGSLQGMPACKIRYQPQGEGARQEIFLTKLPATIPIDLSVAGQPEKGSVRGILFKDNETIGLWSPDFEVTLS